MGRVIPNDNTWVGFALSVTKLGSSNEVQTVGVGAASGGTFTLTYRGYTTSAIAYNAANSAVQTALQALFPIGAGNVTVSGTAPTFTVTFTGALGGQNVAQLTGDGSALTGGTLTITTSTQGVNANTLAPTAAEITAAVELTPFLMSINATSSGNIVPTPSLDTLFETSIIGTSTATFTADFYRDDSNDAAWLTLPRGTKGYFLISRFGGRGANQKPIAGDFVEVWPVSVVSRTATNLANNTVQTMTVTCAVPVEPNDSAVVS